MSGIRAAAILWGALQAFAATAEQTASGFVQTAGSQAVVIACLDAGIDQAVIYRSQGVASGILRQAGIDLRWRRAEVLCADHGIVVTISHQTPGSHHPGALAYAMPFQARRIVLLLDRIREVARPNAEPYVLGHVLAHEVVHVLQGMDQHSTTGLMKPRWSQSDFGQMHRGGLKPTEEDCDLIRTNLRLRRESGGV